MSGIYPKALSRLIEAFESFPGIGRKMAQRLAFHALEMDDNRLEFISDAIKNVKKEVAYCSGKEIFIDEIFIKTTSRYVRG